MSGVFFGVAVVAMAWCIVLNERVTTNQSRHDTEMESYKRVGKWFEKRVAELEQETTVLAAQVIQAGQVPVPKYAMPSPGPDDDAMYSFDDTGLVVDKLDPRELPYG